MMFIKKVLIGTIIVLYMSCYSYSERGWGGFVDVKSTPIYQNNYPKNYGGIQTNSTTNYNEPTIDIRFDTTSPFYYIDELPNTINIQTHSEIKYNRLREFAHSYLIKELADNAKSLIYDRSKNAYCVDGKEIIYEFTVPRGFILKTKDLQGRILDSTLILEKIHTVDDFIKALSSPAVQARLQRIQFLIKMNSMDKSFRKYKHMLEKESAFIDMILSGRISKILNDICYSDAIRSEAAFKELKQLWPYKREHGFLVPSSYKYELQFIQDLGVDIMKIAQRDLITNNDYLKRYCNQLSLQAIKEFRDECVELRKIDNDKALLNKKLSLIRSLEENKNKKDFVTLAKIAIVEKIYGEHITHVFKLITHAPSLEKANDELKRLQEKIIYEGKRRNISNNPALIEWVIDHYGFNILEVARMCYISRPDYVSSPEYKTHFSDKLFLAFDNIENGTLYTAHTQLVYCEQSIKQLFASSNITDEAAQKEHIIKEFGVDVDVINTVRNLYENRVDYQNLVTSFIPIDVSNSMKTILETQSNPIAVANEFDILSKQVFNNVRYYDAEMFAHVEPHIDESIDILRTTKDFREFVLHTIVIDRVLNDAQATAQAAVDGKPILLERSPELIMRAVTKFICALNPITQAENMYELVKDAGHLLNKTIDVATNAVLHPFDTAASIRFFSDKSCEFLVNAACFVSDVTIGKSYLSSDEYKHRINSFWKSVNVFSAEQLVDLGAQIAADFVFAKGLGSTYTFLKEIYAIKRRNQASKIAYKLRDILNTHLADNPIVITAQGIVLKVNKNNIRNVGGRRKEVIKDTKGLLESIETKISNNFDKLEELLSKKIAKEEVSEVTKNVSQKRILPTKGGTSAIPEASLSKESTAINNEIKQLGGATKEITTEVTKIKNFVVSEKMKSHIFSNDHIKSGIRDLAATDELIIDKFVEIINEANFKNLLKEGSNDIIKKINGFDATIRIFIKDGDVLSFNGFKGISARTIGNKICL